MNIEKDKTYEPLELMCTDMMIAHWGKILIPGQEYIGEIKFVPTEIITDYDNYWHYTGLIADSFPWLRKGYDQETLHEVIPGYKSIKEVNQLYTKRIDMPFVSVVCSDGCTNQFCLLSNDEVIALGSDVRDGEPCFSYSVYMVDDYFNYSNIRRDNIIDKLLNESKV